MASMYNVNGHLTPFGRGVHWIAANDAPGDNDNVEALSGYISVVMLADIYNVATRKIAEQVDIIRKTRA